MFEDSSGASVREHMYWNKHGSSTPHHGTQAPSIGLSHATGRLQIGNSLKLLR